MYSRSGSPQWPWAATCSAEGHRQRRDALQRETPLVVLAGVGLVEDLAAHLRRRCLVGADLLLVAAGRLGRALDHHVAADLVVVVAQPMGEPRAGRVEQ